MTDWIQKTLDLIGPEGKEKIKTLISGANSVVSIWDNLPDEAKLGIANAGRRARTRCDLGNVYARIPAGSEGVATRTWRSGVSMEFDPCGKCGISLHLSHISRRNIDLLPIAPRNCEEE